MPLLKVLFSTVSLSLALTPNFVAPTGWTQPSAKLAPTVWENPNQKDMHLTYLAYKHDLEFHKKSAAETAAFVKSLSETKSKADAYLGVTNWQISKYDITDYGQGQLLKMTGTYTDKGKTVYFTEWNYFLPGEQQEIQLTANTQIQTSTDEVQKLMESLKVEKK